MNWIKIAVKVWKLKPKQYFLLNVCDGSGLLYTCSTQTATCAVTEVNESQKCCNNVALNLDECCAVNLRSRTSAWNYPRTDVSMRGLITSWEVWSHLSFLTEVTLWGKLLTAARSAVSSVMQRKSRLSDFNIFCGE